MIDVREEIRERGVVQQDAGDRDDWWTMALKGMANPTSWENSPG